MNRIAIVPGSFDPITNGHINVIERAAMIYDTVYVAVMINDQKKYMFSLEQRKKIVEACFEGRNNIFVISYDGWLWKLAKKLEVCAIVKGYRNNVDLEYERKMADFNEAHYPDGKTVFFEADEALSDLSSTAVRERILSGKSIDEFLPKKAIEIIHKLQ